ncbi:hypothetical protein E8E12_000129 [Didymella heteroderae]|uniref:Uncharacterized protein n=1 Tax=Didymella heteroderae TaxID=1769908 RepID=A0A9P4WFB1_9PLEO|nr:hypothetical protein E8E12_000129 [Didymella heteroderae]
MVAFRKLFASAMALAVPVIAQITPAQIVSNIQLITQKSQALQAPAQSISIINGPLIVIGQGPFPEIIRGLSDIVITGTNAISQMQGTPAVVPGADSDAIYNAFREFVRVHQTLLNVLIGKAGLLNTVPYIGQPMSLVLRQVESVVDTIAFSLIDTVQSRTSDLQGQAASLDGSLQTAINSYDGLSLNRRSLRYARREIAATA